MKFEIPKPMKNEHDELHAHLVAATKAGGRTGEKGPADGPIVRQIDALPAAVVKVALHERKVAAGIALGSPSHGRPPVRGPAPSDDQSMVSSPKRIPPGTSAGGAAVPTASQSRNWAVDASPT